MSRVCQVTGKAPLMGSNVSHSNRHTKKRFEINLRDKRFWLEDEKRWITLRVSTRGMRTIDKLGLAKVVADLRSRGEKI
ncbi:MAG TPA: 50S ribosomal protein L28 [Kofleriaceae bacterium]|jgi:large subunit ribosomal protein L28|nr:50S ribosomal protein L28 [Kofleriaceae bacterium]